MKESNFRKMRKEKGITFEKLCDISGVSYGTIRKLERGAQDDSVNFEIKEKLAKALKIDVFVLFPGELEKLEQKMKKLRRSPVKMQFFVPKDDKK